MSSLPDARDRLEYGGKSFTIFNPLILERSGYAKISRLPYSIRILVENMLRNHDGDVVTDEHVRVTAQWQKKPEPLEIPLKPARVILQDFTGVPCVADLAAMRGTVHKLGKDPRKINPIVPVDLVIDHSVQVDFFGTKDAYEKNVRVEFERNIERYKFLKWAQKNFTNFRVIPPGMGIVHQVNLEFLATVVTTRDGVAFPDSVVGTDSHTTMINGLGVMGWGVGGIEAEAVMLGQPYFMLVPEVIGVRLIGKLREGVIATDLVLTLTNLLRKLGVVDKFVEFFGPGIKNLTLADRATIANMAPEYGATMGFFPVDEETLKYLELTGRDSKLVEDYCRATGLFYNSNSPEPEYTEILEVDLSKIEATLAGPTRPHDRILLSDMKRQFSIDLQKLAGRSEKKKTDGLEDGSVVIAAITSCTNTSNPAALMGAGILAKKAVERGLKAKPYVKTSLAPGSRAVIDYLKKANLLQYLEQLGFYTVGFGCTTCIGNSGPLPDPIASAIRKGNLVAAAVLSGNRNFEARIHPLVRANYLASPILVVAYAIAGRVDIDFQSEAIGTDQDGKPVYLRDIWPTSQEIQVAIVSSLSPQLFRQQYSKVFAGDERWQELKVPESALFDWDKNSTYIQEPPFFIGFKPQPDPVSDIRAARVLAVFGDSITTDHISPAGNIDVDSAAGKYLIGLGVHPRDFNSFGARRGNHNVMERGTFGNVRIKNQILKGTEGSYTIYFPTGEKTTIYEASVKYRQAGIKTIIIAGKEYGSGSSRDWAAKGPYLLGVSAVIAQSFERIHRSNLIGMGILPLQFKEGENAQTLGLDPGEEYFIEGIADISPRKILKVTCGRKTFEVIARLDSKIEVEYFVHRGILLKVLRSMI